MTFLGLPSRSDDVQSMVDFVEGTGVGDFEHLIDAESEIWLALGVTDQPAIAFVDDDGTITLHIGALGEQALTVAVRDLIES